MIEGGSFEASIDIAINACEFIELRLEAARKLASDMAQIICTHWQQRLRYEGCTAWIFTGLRNVSAHPFIVRLNYKAYDEQANLEVAACGSEAAKLLLALILGHSLTHSIYRHKLLSVGFQTGNKDEFGDIEKQERLRINFRLASPVTRDQFVIDD